MAKRNRTKSRFEDMYALAVTSHNNSWPDNQTKKELEELLARNEDLVDDQAKDTARLKFHAMAEPRLAGALPAIRSSTKDLWLANRLERASGFSTNSLGDAARRESWVSHPRFMTPSSKRSEDIDPLLALRRAATRPAKIALR